MQKTLFEKIRDREIPGRFLYEDELVFAILDVNPTTRGHTLVIPKRAYVNVLDIDEEVLAHLMKVAKKLSIQIKDKLRADGINLLHAAGEDAEQSVFHFHLHIVPRYKDDSFHFWPENKDTSDLDEVLELLN